MTDLFYVFGIGLTAMALVISFVGLRSERFPHSRGLYAGVIGLMGVLVVASCAFAVALSREEAEHREEEVAEFEESQAAEAEEEAAQGEEAAEAPGAETEPGEVPAEETEPESQSVSVTSPEDGALIFEPETLEVPAGEIEVEYTNPSDVPHNVAVEADGEEVAASETVTGGESAAATATLEPGEYVFYCAIPGHRESGMEGTLTVTE